MGRLKYFFRGFGITMLVILILAGVVALISVPILTFAHFFGDGNASIIFMIAWLATLFSAAVGLGLALNDGEWQ